MIHVEGTDPNGKPAMLAFVEIPRCGSAYIREALREVGTIDPRIQFSGARCLEPKQHVVVAPIRHPYAWYQSFWRHFVEHRAPPSQILDSHMALAQGRGFDGWLERVTVLGPLDPAARLYMPLNFDGEKHAVTDISAEFWNSGQALFTFMWRRMAHNPARVLRVGPKLFDELEGLLEDFKVLMPFGGLRRQVAAIGWTGAGEGILTDTQQRHVLAGDGDLIDVWRP
jgi:hypothetical protein